MKPKKLSKSVRIYLRRQKAKIHQTVFDIKEQREQIAQVHQSVLPKPKAEKPAVKLQKEELAAAQKENA